MNMSKARGGANYVSCQSCNCQDIGRSVKVGRCGLLFLWLFLPKAANATVRLVWDGSATPAPPYTTWDTAAHEVQTAITAAAVDDTIRVRDGLYAPASEFLVNKRLRADSPCIDAGGDIGYPAGARDVAGLPGFTLPPGKRRHRTVIDARRQRGASKIRRRIGWQRRGTRMGKLTRCSEHLGNILTNTCGGRPGAARAGLAGRFTYEPPLGVKWSG